MKIILAESAGLCEGVRSAVTRAEELSASVPHGVCTLGPLVWDTALQRDLASQGVEPIKHPGEAGDRPLVLPLYGTSPEIRTTLKEDGQEIVDCTCPVVARFLAEVRTAVRSGRRVIIFGDPEDPETQLALSLTQKNGIVVNSPDQIMQIPEGTPITLVGQTTADRLKFETVAAAVQTRWIRANVRYTLCPAAWAKQEEVRRLCGEVDAMVVIGDWQSANVRRLVEIARERGRKVSWVRDATELRRDFFHGVQIVGVSSGTAVPDRLITGVIRVLKMFDREDSIVSDQVTNQQEFE